jgi:hypothetical protein
MYLKIPSVIVIIFIILVNLKLVKFGIKGFKNLYLINVVIKNNVILKFLIIYSLYKNLQLKDFVFIALNVVRFYFPIV